MPIEEIKLMEPTIQTFNGGVINFVDIHESEFDIEDIAHGLANTCRCSGQCKRHYSVATHSVIVSMLLPEKFKLEGLMHDATEAYMCDIPSPLKQLLPEYKAIECRMDRAIRRQFGLPEEVSPEVKYADWLALAIEKPILMGRSRITWDLPDVEKDAAKIIVAQSMIRCATIESSEAFFLQNFKELTYHA